MNSEMALETETDSQGKARVTGKLEGGSKVVGTKAWLFVGGLMLLGFILSKAMDKAMGVAVGKALSQVNTTTAIAIGLISLCILAWFLYAENSNKEDSVAVEGDKLKFSYASVENEDRLLEISDLKSFSVRNFLLFKLYVFKFSEEDHQIKSGVFVRFGGNAASEETEFVEQVRSHGFRPSPARFIYPAIGVLQISLSIFSFLAPAMVAYLMASIKMDVMKTSRQLDDRNYVKNAVVSSLPSINASLPQQLDRVTILEKATVEDYSLLYHYKIVNYNRDLAGFSSALEKQVWPKIVKGNCDDKDAIKLYRPGIFSLRYRYVHESGKKLGEFVFDSSLCAG